MKARLVVDEDVNIAILLGLRRRHPTIDLVDVRDVGLGRTPDPRILEWAARHDRVVVSHDVSTMRPAADARVVLGDRLAGLILVPQDYRVGRAIADIAELVDRSDVDPLEGRIVFLPLDKSWRVSEEEPAWATLSA